MTTQSPILKADDLSKRYEDGVLALDHLNLDVHGGEVYCLLGANGAGKTTTINLFLNFIPPTTGTCFITGIDVTKDPLEAKKYVAFVSETSCSTETSRPARTWTSSPSWAASPT